MKKIIILSVAAALAFSFTACEDALDSTNYTKANTGNFPSSANDFDQELNATYYTLNELQADPLQFPYFVWDLMSDDQNGGGGTGDVESHAIGHIMYNKEDILDNAWTHIYAGIARASTIIYSIDNVIDWAAEREEDTRDQMLGEAYFLRGLFYLWGTQMFGDIPAYWSASVPEPCPQVSAEDEIYPHIFADFLSAASLINKVEDGRATKYAAEAMLARAYMFYQGFYKKAGELAKAESCADVELPEQEGVTSPLTKANVVSALEDICNNGPYILAPDFRSLWQYTNELTVNSDGEQDGYALKYDYVSDVTEYFQNGNEEQIFQIRFQNISSWNTAYAMGYTNMTSLYTGLRCDSDGDGLENGGPETFPFGQGWGQGTVNAQLWDDWSDSDPRKKASILDCQDTDEIAAFAFTSSCTEDAGYYAKKLIPVTAEGTDWGDHTSVYTWWGVYRNDQGYTNTNGNSFQGDHFADIVLIRLADVYLMHSELTGTATYLNMVRGRAGLSDTSYSLANIQNERRFELAFEGVRFNDLRRWSGKDGGTSCLAATTLEKQNGTRVNYIGTWTTMHHAASSWAQRYAETDGFLRIPSTQIDLVGDENVLKQNAGWGSDVSDAAMSGTPVY